MVQECLRILESGDPKELFKIIPGIGVLRDPRFCGPLTALLSDKNAKRREFAACAMGAMGNEEFLEPLERAFLDSQKSRAPGSEAFQLAIIEAIGSIGQDAAAGFFLGFLKAASEKPAGRLQRCIVESLGEIAQQGGARCLDALIGLTSHGDPELRAQAISELPIAYWHRPNEIAQSTIAQLCRLAKDRHPAVAEAALAALQSLADVGCHQAERWFSTGGQS